MHNGFVVKINHLREHPNADKLKIATFFGEDVIVDLSCEIGDIGVYFPCDLQLSQEFCIYNHLLRKMPDGTPGPGYMDPDKRNVKAIKLRGEKSYGVYLPISCLAYCFDSDNPDVGVMDLSVGDQITVVNGHEICKKYIPRSNRSAGRGPAGNHTRKKKVPIAPLFAEHADTEQLAYNLGAFKTGDEIEITLKIHGTSARTGYLPTLKGYKRSLLDRILRREGTPIYEWGYVSGTRRTVLENYEGGFYGSNKFREQHSKFFEGKLNKGETVYYEICGFIDNGTPIMASCDNSKIKDKEFTKQYGKTTTFSYGCIPDGYTETNFVVAGEPQSDIYVYRMTLTNADGFVVEYTPDFMRYRCEQMGVKTVPVMWKGIIREDLRTEDFFCNNNGEFEDWVYATSAGDWIKNKAEQYYDGPDPIGKTHIREGVVVRILNRPKFTAYKHKNFYFKVLENIIKDTSDAPDMEEAEELIREDKEVSE